MSGLCTEKAVDKANASFKTLRTLSRRNANVQSRITGTSSISLQAIIPANSFFNCHILENNVDAFVIDLVSAILNNVVVAEVLKKLNLVLSYGYRSYVVLTHRDISCFRSNYCRLRDQNA
jgi:hypothetical protein